MEPAISRPYHVITGLVLPGHNYDLIITDYKKKCDLNRHFPDSPDEWQSISRKATGKK